MVSIIIDNGGTILGVVTEVHVRTARFLQVHQILAMVGVIGVIGIIHGLADAHAAGIVGEGDTLAGVFHSTQLATLFPGIVPGAVREGIANSVVGVGDTIVRSQLIFPIAVVGVVIRTQNGGGRITVFIACSGEGVVLLIDDVAAPVVFKRPGGAAAAAGNGIEGIVGADQLAQEIVLVGGHDAVPGNGSDIAVVVVGIGEVFGVISATLGDGSDEGSGGVFLRAREIGVGSSVGSAVHLDSTGSQAPQIIIGVYDFGIIPFQIGEAIADLGGLALDIIGEIGAIEIKASGNPLLEGFGLTEFIVGETGVVKMAAVFQSGDLVGAVGHVKFADGHTIQVLIRHLGDLAVGSVIVYVTVFRIGVIAHALQPLECIVGVHYLAAVAEGRFLQGVIVIIFFVKRRMEVLFLAGSHKRTGHPVTPDGLSCLLHNAKSCYFFSCLKI